MIIIDERNFLLNELKDKGFGIFDFFENCQTMNLTQFNNLELKRRSDFLLVDTETLLKHPDLQEQFKTVLNTFLGTIFFHDHSNTKAQEWVKNEGAFLTKILGEYSLPMPQLNWTMLTNQLQFFWTLLQDQKKLQRHITEFSHELDQVLESAESEMIRAKKIYETLVPKKSEEIKGIHFKNKYAVGEGGGVEFYDLLQTNGKVFHVLLSTQSYLISSAILGLLSQHKDRDFVPGKFLDDVKAEIQVINQAKKKKSEVDVLILELDLNTLMLTKTGESKAEAYSQLSGVIDLSTSYKMTKGEKVVVLSPGFIFNWREGRHKKPLPEFLALHSSDSSDLMSELFFHLKEDKEERMLHKDATVFMMEVNRHGIHKV